MRGDQKKVRIKLITDKVKNFFKILKITLVE